MKFLGTPETVTTEKLGEFYRPVRPAGLVANAERVLSVAMLLGMEHVLSDLSLADPGMVDAEPLPFDEAIKFLKGRVPVTKKEWAGLEDKLRFRAFTVATLQTYDLVEQVRQRLIKSLEDGDSMSDAWADCKQFAQSPQHWETTYRTNIQTAYNAGRRIQIDKEKPAAMALIVLDDQRTSPFCRPLVGLVLPADHPFWATHWPPFHFGCRTTVRPVYKESGEWANTKTPSMASLRKTFTPQDGFGSNPVDSGNYWMMTPQMFNRGLKTGAITEMNAMDNVVQNFDQVWPNYTRASGKQGGWVDVADGIQSAPEFDQNKVAADLLSASGQNVKMLPQYYRQGWKNPDFMIDGRLWELETPAEVSESAIDRAIRSGQHQAPNLILHLTSEADMDMVKHVAWKRLGRKDSATKFERLMIIKADGSYQEYSAAQILKGWH